MVDLLEIASALREWLWANLPVLISAAIVVAVGYALDKILVSWIRRTGRKRDIEPTAINAVVIIVHAGILAGVCMGLVALAGLPAEWFIGILSLTGAAVGFASARTVGNFLSGLYIMITRPFLIGDYIKTSKGEGIVEELGINYTKIRTLSGTRILISNDAMLKETIFNYTVHEGDQRFYACPLEVTLPEGARDRAERTLREVQEKYSEKMARPPSIELAGADVTKKTRTYRIQYFVKEAGDILEIREAILEGIYGKS